MNIKDFFKDKMILVAGGTGTIGLEIVKQLLECNPKNIRILSNSENELWETQIKLKKYSSKLRFLLGDIRNFERMKLALVNIDYVFNAAAIKHVPISEYNPMEAINVNIHGANNIIESSILNNVKKMIHISTDKAINPTTVMGATKMLSERLCISRNAAKSTSPLLISCVRFGNVLGSRGSIVPLIKKQIENGNEVTLTSDKMRRFFMSVSQAVKLVLKAMTMVEGGEIFVLKMPTIRIKDLIEVIIEEYAPIVNKDPNSIKIKEIGARAGEKMNEELISSIEYNLYDEKEKLYIVRPKISFINNNKDNIPIQDNESRFSYSTKNAKALKKEEIRKNLKDLNLI